MNICFIANFSKTRLFKAIARELKPKGITTFWIATNRKIYQALSHTFGEDKVLMINRKNIRKTAASIGEFKINELVYGDRVLRHHPKEGRLFLTNIQKPIFDFLKQHKIRKVLGEITWAHEVLIHRICQHIPELNCQFLNPHVVRIPDNRFAFFTDERQSKLLDIEKNAGFFWKPLSPKAPSYLAINKKILNKTASFSGRLNRLKRFVTNENMDVLDPTLLADPKARIQTRASEEWRREQYKMVKTTPFDPKKSAAYVYLGLHKQPEASVDVLGRYYEDQLQNIKNLWRCLPENWILVVKEHSIAIGDRALSFYKTIQQLPGVVLVSEQASSYDLIRNAALVATVTGTIAYEAALLGVPAVTFAPVFFNQLNRCKQIGLEDLDQYSLEEITLGLKEQAENISSFSRAIYKNSFSGNFLDPISDPEVLNPKNIQLLVGAMCQAFQMEVETKETK